MDFVWTVSGATLFAIGGWLCSSIVFTIAFVWNRSKSEATAAGLLASHHKRIEALEHGDSTIREAFDCDIKATQEMDKSLFERCDRKVDAVSAGMTLMREQAAERGTRNAEMFATKHELDIVERRFASAQDQIMTSLRRIDARLDEALKTRA